MLATRTQNVIGKGQWIKVLTAVVPEEFDFPQGSVKLYEE